MERFHVLRMALVMFALIALGLLLLLLAYMFAPPAYADEPIRRMPPVVAPGGGPAQQVDQPADQPDDRDRLIQAVTSGEVVFVARLTSAQAGMQTMSFPPTTYYTMSFEGCDMLRGDKPADGATFSYSHREGSPGAPVVGTKFIVVATAPPANQPKQPAPAVGPRLQIGRSPAGGAGVRALIEATDENVALARKLVTLPVGWSVDEKGNTISPWAQLGDKAWPKGLKIEGAGEAVCSRTGRPVLTVPDGVTLKVEQVIPEKVEKFQNPYGDGEFTVTVTNTTDKDLAVPALLASDGKILWAESLIIIERGRTRLLPSAGAVDATAKPVTIKAGQSVSAVVNTLTLEGVSWPRGGSRVMFKFAVGNRVDENFFYYFSNRHDAIRAKARAADGVRPAPAPAARPQPVAGGWTKLFADEKWYQGQGGREQEYVGTLEAIPQADGMATTLQRTSYYKLGGRNIYTGAKKVDALDKLVGQKVVIRGKPYDINLEGQSVSEIWPAAIRPGADTDKPTPNAPGNVQMLGPVTAPRPE